MFYTDDLNFVFSLHGHTKDISSLSWNPDSTLLASGSDDATIRIWDIQTHKTVNIYRGHTGAITHVRWSPDGTLIASTNTLGPTADFLIFEPMSNTYKYKLPASYKEPTFNSFLRTIAWSPTSKQIAVADQYFGVGIWDVPSQKVTLQIADQYMIDDIAWSPDGQKIAVAVGSNPDILGYSSIWNAKTGELLFELNGDTNWATSVAWSPDGNYLATSGEDQTIKIWNASNGRITNELSFPDSDSFIRPNYINWSPDSKRIAWTLGEHKVCISSSDSNSNPKCVEIMNIQEF